MVDTLDVEGSMNCGFHYGWAQFLCLLRDMVRVYAWWLPQIEARGLYGLP